MMLFFYFLPVVWALIITGLTHWAMKRQGALPDSHLGEVLLVAFLVLCPLVNIIYGLFITVYFIAECAPTIQVVKGNNK